jgi:hypothetical protein
MKISRLLILIPLLAAGCASTSALPTLELTPSLPAPVVTVVVQSPTASLSAAASVQQPSPTQPASSPAAAAQPTSTSAAPPTPAPTLAPQAWKSLPVIPASMPEIGRIYARGLELGNNPNVFSKIGDCGSTPAWFLGDFDRGPQYYRLGEYTDLQPVIDQFKGSFSRTSLAAKSGFNASSIFASLWSDRTQCEANETPLGCEYRVNRPALALIMLGTNDVYHQDVFEPQMRKIIEYSIENGVIPVLSTKADNLEGDGSINAAIAALANEYGLPLWNYWLAVQDLPDQGLQPDSAHITWGPTRFDDPAAMQKGWPVRNLTALQVLDAVWKEMR